MKHYEIEYTETLSNTIIIEANDEEHAYQIANEMYNNEEIILDSEDYDGVDINVKGEV